MEIDNRRETIIQSVIVSFLGVFVLILLSIILIYMRQPDLRLNIQVLLQLFLKNETNWVLTSLVVLIPLSMFFIARSADARALKLHKDILKREKNEKRVTEFISRLRDEDFAVDIESAEDDDLSKSLIDLRDTQKRNKELVENQRKEDEKRNWHAEGLATFSEILRTNSSNMELMAFNVLRNLTDYVDAIQGGFYLLVDNEKDKYFDLVAFYAYGRKKFADNKIKWGKGLIGTAASEGKSIHMNKVPHSYLEVTSGLGQAPPKELIVSPMIANDTLFGVIEIASMNEFTEDHLKFIEKASESTASTIATVKTNMRTAELLQESKEQAQALAAQEEEMRQNMEELQATQEEASRQASRFMKLENTVNHTMIRAEYSTDGVLIYANTHFLDKLEYKSNSDVEGKHILMFISDKDEEWFNRLWIDLQEGGRHFEGYMKHVTRTGKDLWTMATYTCIRDEEGNVEKVLFLALDTTEQKRLSQNLTGIVDAVNRSSIKIGFDINGNIQEFNESFIYLFKYSEKEIDKLNVFDLLDALELEVFNKKWENIVNGMNFQGQFKVKTKKEEERWIRGAFSAVYDMYNEVDKVIFIGQDITNEKLMEIESKNQNEILKKQEKMLRESEKELSRKLREAKLEMQEQFKEIENIKIRNEKTLEGALDTIITTTHDNKIVFYNNAAVLLLGYTKEEVIGKNIDMLFSEQTIKDDDFVSKYVSKGNNKIVGVRKEISMLTKDGDEIAVLILLSQAEVENKNTYTAFIQTIEVELF